MRRFAYLGSVFALSMTLSLINIRPAAASDVSQDMTSATISLNDAGGGTATSCTIVSGPGHFSGVNNAGAISGTWTFEARSYCNGNMQHLKTRALLEFNRVSRIPGSTSECDGGTFGTQNPCTATRSTGSHYCALCNGDWRIRGEFTLVWPSVIDVFTQLNYDPTICLPTNQHTIVCVLYTSEGTL